MSALSVAMRLTAILALAIGATTCGLSVRAGGVVGEALQARLARLQPGDPVGVIIRFAGKADLTSLQGMTPSQRRDALPGLLREHAEAVQAPLRAHLESLGVSGIRTLWINNAMAAVVPVSVVGDLAVREDVKRIDLDTTVQLPRPVNRRR